jgi:hypothetical protein
MAHSRSLTAVLALGAIGLCSSARAQSLGDLAQKEKEKREAARAAGATKVYKDGDLAAYSEERVSGSEEAAAPAMSATPKEGAPRKGAAPTPAPPPEEEERTEPSPAASAEELRARWRNAQSQLGAAERRLAAAEAEMKTLPPGLPAGNYYEDIRAAVEQQKVEREARLVAAQKAVAAAKEAVDAVETEARRKQIRLD